jgi:ABC-type amino acid transport substrate-binding protein
MRLARLMAFMAAACAAAPAAAQQADVDALKAEAARMRQSLDELDAKIRTMEGEKSVAPAAAPAVAPAAAPAAKPDDKQPAGSYVSLQQNWSQVQTGLPKERIDALLGKPDRVMQINGDDVWYYVYPGFGRGSVFFNTKGIVTASQSPRIGWGW